MSDIKKIDWAKIDFDADQLTTTQLLAGGWTRTLIAKFLPRPDGSVPVNHWENFRGQNTYSAAKVWNVEHSEAFQSAFMSSWKGRMKGQDPADLLAQIRAKPRPKVVPLTKDEIKRKITVARCAELMQGIRGAPYKC